MKFNQSYNRKLFEDFLLSKPFGGDKYRKNYKKINIDRKTMFFDENNCFILGKVHLDQDVFVLEIKQKSKKDPRITLTKDAFKIMEDVGANYALVIFYSDDVKNYRLSLLTRKKFFGEKEESDAKRYSFLLGEGEKVKTPERQLSKSINSFQELFDAFDVEVVRKEFFNSYLDLYIRLYREIIKDTSFIKLLHSQKIDIVSFAKTLLGKLVFLYFIQKKGWLGVSRGGEYGKNGDKDFMRTIWNDFKNNEESLSIEKKGYFYNDYLEWLFYEGLNKDRRDSEDYFANLQMKVPYLNGGLFKEDYRDWEKGISKISNEIFSNNEKNGILDIFDTYNFTVDEDDLYDKEIAVDPEMLGKIFEKMISISSENIDIILEEYNKNESLGKKKKIEIDNLLNKKLGAFYTPREIVHYMTKESLISYLVNNLKGKKEENEAKMRKLFDLKEQFLVTKDEITETVFSSLSLSIVEVDELLKRVKVLDPAVGSGAFPMGLLHEISSIRYYIYEVFSQTFGVNKQEYKNESGKISMYKIKRDVIQNNIYGVDISAGAIEIARLRFWLSLVVDEETPEPLPNFEFKFVCANTLIPLEEEQQQGQLELDNMQKEINTETLRKYMVNHYNAQSNKDKEEQKVKIEKFLGIGKNTVLDLYNTKSARTKQLETYEPFNPNHSAGFFDPSLMMGNSKFDIVIGNPPYIKEYDNRNAFDGLRGKEYYIGKMDIWYFFACYGLDLLKDGGVESFIAQNNWITSFGAKIMRNKILEDARIKEFIDFGDFKVFETAGIQTMIYILEKTKSNSKYEVKYSRVETKDFDRRNIDKFLSDTKDSIDYKKHYSKIDKLKYLNKTLDFADDEKDSILEKIYNNGDFKLTEKEVAQGMIGGPDEAFIYKDITMLTNSEKEFVHNYYTNVGRYYKENDEKYISYLTRNNITELTPNTPNFLDKINYFKDKLLNRRECLSGQIQYFHLHWPRDEKFFKKGEKIVCGTRVPSPSFYYTEDEYYGSRALNFIKTDRIHLKYLTGILNSKLSFFWLKNKGKLLGNLLQVDKSHLLNIPLKQASLEKQNSIIELVDRVLEITKQSFYDPKNPPEEQKILEDAIDTMVYELYGLTGDEIEIIERSLK